MPPNHLHHHTGSTSTNTLQAEALLDRQQRVWIPYDKNQMRMPDEEFQPLSHVNVAHSAHRAPFRLDYAKIKKLLIINGMGVTLGDSVIGISLLAWLLERNPALHITLWRSAATPAYVEEIYANISPRLATVKLPQPLSATAAFDAVIDLSDFMFRKAFDEMAMIDFFTISLGIEPCEVPAVVKSNRWIADVHVPSGTAEPYVLFCPGSSAAVRAIPQDQHHALIDHLWKTYRTRIKGFSSAVHPAFEDLTPHSPTTSAFIGHIANATHVMTADSAAVHIAAGFDIPTTAFFTSIPSRLRTRDYPHCQAIDLDTAGVLTGLHTTTSPRLLQHSAQLWKQAFSFIG